MTLLELHYTSAEQGLGGSPGFQFVQLSTGLDTGICRQVESLLAYEPPRTAPSQPTSAEIAGFPVALSNTLLADGAAVLCNTTYTGTDYSGRFGNFYAHALYLPGGPGDLGSVLPIDTWASAFWRTRPPAANLPAAERMEPGQAITRDTLLAFTSQRCDQLAAVLTDIINSFGKHEPQVILAEDDANTVALWIATACHSLPRALARRLTFTTYTRRPQMSSQQVIGIMPGSDFSFTYTELTSQYRVHAKPGQSSPWADPLAWSATAAAIWLVGKPELFDAAYADIIIPRDGPDTVWADTLAGPLAATALAAGVDLQEAGTAAAVAWANANAGAQRTQQFWQGLAVGVARSSGQIPLAALERLCQQTDARYPAKVTTPLLTAYLCRLFGEITNDVVPDPNTIRWVTGRLRLDHHLVEAVGVRDRLEAAFSKEPPVGLALLLLQIADAAGIQDVGAAAHTVLGPALLVGGRQAFEVAEFLNATANAELQTRVLDFLEDAARHSGGRAAAQLVSGAGKHWLLAADLGDFPLLCTAARLATEHGVSRVAAFRLAAALLSASDSRDLAYAYGLAWPDRSPTLSEACELLSEESALPILEIPGTAEAFIGLIRHASVIGTETIQLADLLRVRIPRPDPRDRALLDLVAVTEPLREAARHPRDATLAQELPRSALVLLTAWPYPEPVRDAAADALLTLLTAPSRLINAGIAVRAELHILVTSGDADLVAAFAERASQALAGELASSPQLHATCFTLWRLEYGHPGDQTWPAARDSLMTGLLAPAAHKMDDRTRELTARLINERSPGLGNEWLQLIQVHGPTTRQVWSRLLYRRKR
jgi:GTPase-associated protein 1, N-terminal domain type 2/GTPase-associated protein 1, C-terminal domain/GTPase-associated protein 1, middle domain